MKRPAWLVVPMSLVLASAAQAQSAMPAAQNTHDMTGVRAALDKYRDPIAAVRDGYFSTIGCVDFPQPGGTGEMQYVAGGMGVHLLNPGLIGPQLDTLHPQVLLYEPDRSGRLTLVAAEWFMPTQISATQPTLFGRPMDGPMEGHAPIMSADMHHWDMHVWLWKNNPAGMFSPTNPTVHCPDGQPYSFHGEPPHMVH